jgi:hypothetical protein
MFGILEEIWFWGYLAADENLDKMGHQEFH